MMCPVAVANEMSGLKGRVRKIEHSQRRLASALISGPSFGVGHEDQGSHHTSHERENQLDPGCRDPGNVGPAVATVEKPLERVWLRWIVRLPDATSESETSAAGPSGESADAVPREVLRPERATFRREVANRAPDFTELYLGEERAADCRFGE